ncbi:hypothetical protein CBR_g38666 [Chara braunii]|uniref:Uncharacterized protein n=1 Tax=Chara braunii TaxID=69332 RepID=A0A388K0K7_CHABU|nr:hypothetical protein CBR_g38666 [Chara braunii]|eukprot:GBG63600.1 hypothetical protein CBR_g38666 [Chara braunii]
MALCVVASSSTLLSGWDDGYLRCHAIRGGKMLWSIPNAHARAVTAIALAKGEHFLVSGGEAGDVRIWELRNRDLVMSFEEHSMRITKIVILADDLHIVSSSRDRTVRCWKVKQSRSFASRFEKVGALNGVAISPDQLYIVTAGQDRKITVWDMREREPAIEITEAHRGEVTCVAIPSKGGVFLTGGADHFLRLWDLATGNLLAHGLAHSSRITSVSFSPDDKKILSTGNEGALMIWNMDY